MAERIMISDQDLLLYYYRDGLDAAERARIAAALSEQPELAARLHRLVARLDAAAAAPEVIVPEHVKQRWNAALQRAANGTQTIDRRAPAPRFAGWSWRLAAAACALVLVVISLRVGMQQDQDRVAARTTPAPTTPTVEANDASAYERGLRLHLATTEWQLASLDTVSGDERTRLIETIIAQNRLYAVAAERAGEPQLARVMRAFTPILERLADDRSEDSAGEIAQLNFELNVLQARLGATNASESSADSLAL
jgi:hypothetical protein